MRKRASRRASRLVASRPPFARSPPRYNYCRPQPLRIAVAWNVLFCVVNACQVRRLLRRERPVTFSARELEAFAAGHLLDQLKPSVFRKLLDAGAEIVEIQAGETLITQVGSAFL